MPHALYDWPARWLARNLHIRLRAVLADDVRVRVTESGRTASTVEWGGISIGPIVLPLRNESAERLRQIIEDAADRADDVAAEATEHGRAFDRALRRA